MELATRIAKLLDEREQSQSWLARKTGIDQSSLSKVISGKQRLYADQLAEIAAVLGVSPNELLGVPTQPAELPPEEFAALAVVRELGPKEAMKRLLRPPGTVFGPVEPQSGYKDDQKKTGTK